MNKCCVPMISVSIAMVLLLPIGIIMGSVFTPWAAETSGFIDSVLKDVVVATLIMMIGVASLSVLIGGSCAYLVTMYDFPMKRFFKVALLFPLAVPPYIAAFIYGGLLEYAGPIQTSLRHSGILEQNETLFFQIRSLGGAILVFTFVLYPYLYLLVKRKIEHMLCYHDIALVCGASRVLFIKRILIPMIRPAVVIGVAIILMEVLADFGAIAHLAVDGFTTVIYYSWFHLNDASSALRLSAMLLLCMGGLLWLERYGRGKTNYTSHDMTVMPGQPTSTIVQTASLTHGIMMWCVCSIPILFGFIIPVGQMMIWSFMYYDGVVEQGLLTYLGNSLMVGVAASVLTALIALLFVYTLRHYNGRIITGLIRSSVLGYAVPGTVAAVGILALLGQIDHTINDMTMWLINEPVGLILSGSVVALLFAYILRFLTLSFASIESSMMHVSHLLDSVALLYGKSARYIVSKVYLPMIWPAFMSACLLVFVEVVKELPATLIIRPFNFETLATYSYQLVEDERLRESALPSLCIVAICVASMIWFHLVSRPHSIYGK